MGQLVQKSQFMNVDVGDAIENLLMKSFILV